MAEDAPLLVVVSGPPAAGKTTLARLVARRLRLTLFTRDVFKETLFDELGWSDREWSRRVGRASFGVLFEVLACQLDGGADAIAETNFDPATADEWFRGSASGRPSVR